MAVYLTLTLVIKKGFVTPRNIYMQYESSITYHSKAQKDKLTDGQTSQKLYAPDLSMQGHNKEIIELDDKYL